MGLAHEPETGGVQPGLQPNDTTNRLRHPACVRAFHSDRHGGSGSSDARLAGSAKHELGIVPGKWRYCGVHEESPVIVEEEVVDTGVRAD